jgi:hypothetical protein
MIIVIEKSPETAGKKQEIKTAVEQLLKGINRKGNVKVISANTEPEIEAENIPAVVRNINTIVMDGNDRNWSFSKSIRLAVSELMFSRNRKAVVFIGSGKIFPENIRGESLVNLGNYLKNNNILFYNIELSDYGKTGPGFEHGYFTENIEQLVSAGKGKTFFLYRPEGIEGLAAEIRKHKYGTYVYRFTSTANPDFGKALIPVAVQAVLYKKSGRAESGYFAPMDFKSR